MVALDDAVDAPLFRLLGTLQVGDGQECRIPPGRQQIVLASLLLEANHVVSIDKMIDAIWEDDPPETARKQVQICVSRVRGRLIAAGCGEMIATRSPGYVMRVEPDQLDVLLFTTLVGTAESAAGSGDLDAAAGLLNRAMALWRGPALSGINSPPLMARATQLDEGRLEAIESCAEIELRRGRHHQMVGQLSALVREYPLREMLRGQLMVALYRSGRQAEALETYRVGRELLVDQLGIEPGAELRRLEGSILAGDVTSSLGTTAVTRADAEVVVPLQLPTDIADFTGRVELIDRTERLARGQQETGADYATRVVVLAGKPGIGKSALAVHVAHRLSEAHFPDGQLYCDLGGSRVEPVRAVDVLGRFLRALGVSGASIPDTTDERAEMVRNLMARKKILILLDDAASEGQITALLPGSGQSVVLVTSRTRLTGLPGAHVLDVEVFDQHEAIAMVAGVIGRERVEAEPVAARALIRLVGRLPLALRIVAARLGARPHWSLAWMVERLSDERRRLDELAHGDLVVRASLALTYDGLPPQASRLLRLLGALDGLSFPGWVAAALIDADYLDAADLLEELVDAQMVEVAAIDRTGNPHYKLHGLIRLFAREQLDRDESVEERTAAIGRVAGGWLGMLDAAHRAIYGGDFTVLHGMAPRWPTPGAYGAAALLDPLAWMESEHANLCSAVELTAEAGLDECCWDLAVSLVTLFEARCYFDDWQRTHRLALKAVRAKGNRRGQAALGGSLGSLYLSQGIAHAAEEQLLPSLHEFEELGDIHGAAITRRNLAMLYQARGDADQALDHFAAALDGFRTVADPIGQAHVLGQIAQIELDRDEPATAGAHLADALGMCREVGNQRVEVQLRFRQSELMLYEDRCMEARAVLTDLLSMVRDSGDVVGQSKILHQLGKVNVRLGHRDLAEQLFAEALTVLEQNHAGADRVREELAQLGDS